MKRYPVIFKNHSIIAYFDLRLKSQPKSYNPHIIDAVAKSNTRLSSCKYSANPFTDHFFSKVLKFLFRGYNQTSLIGTLIFPGGPSFPLPLVCPTLHQLAAL